MTSDKPINELELETFIEIILDVYGDNPLYTKDYLTNLAETDPLNLRLLAGAATTAAEGGSSADGGAEEAMERALGAQPPVVSSTTTDGIRVTDVLGMQSLPSGAGGGIPYTVGDFSNELAAMSPEEQNRLQQALYLEGYYGNISDISEIADPTRFNNALLGALKHGVSAFGGVAKTAAGMEAVPLLRGRFSDFSSEEFEAAKQALLKRTTPATKSLAELKEIIDEVATSKARRGLTTDETQTVIQALQAAAAQNAASPLNEAFSYERAAGEAVVDVIGPAEAESVGVQDFFDRYVKQIFS